MVDNGGKMRLIMGCEFTPQDLEAIQKGYSLRDALWERLDASFTPPENFAQLKHLEILSWLIANECLDIKIAVPLKQNGLPDVEQLDSKHIFHEKVGIFTDINGDKLVFNGSNNESIGGWEKNVESFHVYCSWEGGRELDRVEEEVSRFEQLWVVDLAGGEKKPEWMSSEEQVYRALVLGTRDYLQKCGFGEVVLGLSGGIDSALTAVIAAEALGPDKVLGVAMPSRFSSEGSVKDAEALAKRLKIRYLQIPIEGSFQAMLASIAPARGGKTGGLTEENLQSRLRGVILMAISNDTGRLLLTTGNKSELAVGYCTLYGDMCGALAVIADVPKTMVYRVARWVNREREIIPASSIRKAPSAELRPNQTDQDSLPPYAELDRILESYVVHEGSIQAMAKKGISKKTAQEIVRKIDLSEYKRRQAAPGLKIATKAFGVGRRMPIAQKFDPRVG